MQFFSDRGRPPVKGELANEAEIIREFHSIARAFAIIQQATDRTEWARIAEKRREDMLVYIALSRFDRRPNFTALPAEIRNDIKIIKSSPG